MVREKGKKVPPDPFNFGSIYGQGRTVDHALDSSFLQCPNSKQSKKIIVIWPISTNFSRLKSKFLKIKILELKGPSRFELLYLCS